MSNSKTKPLNRDKTREQFFNAGLSYSSLNSTHIAKLRNLVKAELKVHDKQMTLLKTKAKYGASTGTLRYAELRVKAQNFKDREAITFNPDGFIGFAGWADAGNVQPFLRAFEKWVKVIGAPVFFELAHFKQVDNVKKDGLCGADFERPDDIETINLNSVLSVSSYGPFKLPLSGKVSGYFALVTMRNSQGYCIRKPAYKDLKKALNDLRR